jgi:hypothetical protein
LKSNEFYLSLKVRGGGPTASRWGLSREVGRKKESGRVMRWAGGMGLRQKDLEEWGKCVDLLLSYNNQQAHHGR